MGEKACGCAVGFCRAETMLEALTTVVMQGDNERAAWLQRAYEAQRERCVGGWRAVPPKEGE